MERRRFLKSAPLAVAGAGLLSGSAVKALGHPRWAAAEATVPFGLGVATYSLRAFNRADAIEMLRAMRVSSASVKSFHLEYDDSPAELAAGTRAFKNAGIEPVSCGLVTFSQDTDEHVRRYFDYARHAGIPMIIMTAAPAILPRIERFVEEYDIPVAIHNHGPEDKYYPAPSDALKHISDMDPRVGVCVDVGHAARTGVDVVEAIRDCGDRLLDIHMKDLADMMVKESQVEVGHGKMPVADIFRQLVDMGYDGSVNLEYEINEDDPLAGMIESMAYQRGVLSGLYG